MAPKMPTNRDPILPDNGQRVFKNMTAAIRFIRSRFRERIVVAVTGYDREVKINIRGRPETAYHTQGPDDAVATALSMFTESKPKSK